MISLALLHHQFCSFVTLLSIVLRQTCDIKYSISFWQKEIELISFLTYLQTIST